MFYIFAIVWFIIDQVSKNYVQHHMQLGQSIPIIPDIFHLTYILNQGAAFGVLAGRWYFLMLVAIVLVIAIAYCHKTIFNGPWYLQLGAALLVSGALGNAWDRFQLKAVVDFFDFRVWPIFNVADIGICVGVVLVAIFVYRHVDSK